MKVSYGGKRRNKKEPGVNMAGGKRQKTARAENKKAVKEDRRNAVKEVTN